MACGYQSTQVPIIDYTGQFIPLLRNGRKDLNIHKEDQKTSINQAEQVDVSHQCSLIDSKTLKPITGLYGIGQGFSLETSDSSVNAEQRRGAKADSVGLYIKQIGNKILE
jgi:hypothetical protein